MPIDVQIARQIFQNRLQQDFDEREMARKEALQAVYAAAPQIIAGYSTVKSAHLFGSILHFLNT